MNSGLPPRSGLCHGSRGLTLMELLVATALGSIMVTVIFALTGFGQRSFAIVANDSQLDAKSRYALDLLTREIQQATSITAATSNSSSKTLTLTNAASSSLLTIAWSAEDRTLTFNETGASSFLTNRTLLTACDQWDYFLYGHAVNISAGNAAPVPMTALANCKMIGLTWSCCTNLGKITNRVTRAAQIALRNRVN